MKAEREFEEVARKEADVLKMMRDLRCPHLIQAIAYYERDQQHFFIFPWADKGNLRSYWGSKSPETEPLYLKWVFSQLAGLAEAIKLFHKQLNCRHGDLKPENILCFDGGGDEENPYGRLVITDFGLARIHKDVTQNRIEATSTRGATILYAPPEFNSNEPRSRRYDIWSLGCMYLEFVIWLIWGNDSLESFLEGINGPFYINYAGKSQVHTNVGMWVQAIRDDPRCGKGTAVDRLIDLIISKMLVVAVSVDAAGESTNNSIVVV